MKVVLCLFFLCFLASCTTNQKLSDNDEGELTIIIKNGSDRPVTVSQKKPNQH